jgi:hypothetical protein
MPNQCLFTVHGRLVQPGSLTAGSQLNTIITWNWIQVLLLNQFSCPQCPTCKDCASEELDCFVLDHNGYVVLAENRNLTGQFFGYVEGAVMDSLRIDSAVFRKIPMFDYQGLCTDEVADNSTANFILNVSFIFMFYKLTHPISFSAVVKF